MLRWLELDWNLQNGNVKVWFHTKGVYKGCLWGARGRRGGMGRASIMASKGRGKEEGSAHEQSGSCM